MVVGGLAKGPSIRSPAIVPKDSAATAPCSSSPTSASAACAAWICPENPNAQSASDASSVTPRAAVTNCRSAGAPPRANNASGKRHEGPRTAATRRQAGHTAGRPRTSPVSIAASRTAASWEPSRASTCASSPGLRPRRTTLRAAICNSRSLEERNAQSGRSGMPGGSGRPASARRMVACIAGELLPSRGRSRA